MEQISTSLEQIIAELLGLDVSVEVTRAPEGIEADVASNVAMKLAKRVGQNPRELAETLKTEFIKRTQASSLAGTEVEIVGPGFLNFKLSNNFFVQEIQGWASNFIEKIEQNDYRDKSVVIEFSDPNPFKVLHVGHLYTSIMGESMARLIEFGGGKVHRANFGGDVGLHVAKCLYRARQLFGAEEIEQVELDRSGIKNRADWLQASPEAGADFLARCYVEGTRLYEDDEKARAEITRLNKLFYKIAEAGEGNEVALEKEASAEERAEAKELAELYWRGRDLSYKSFARFYKRIGIEFEKYYPESTVTERGLKEVKSRVPAVYEESEGAIVFRGERYGLHTRVFVTKEGIPTYETKDVGLLFTKYDDYQFDQSIVITGNEQNEYMKVVLKSIEQYAPEIVQKSKHITHGMVRLAGDIKMGSRKGNFIRALDVLNNTRLALAEAAEETGVMKDETKVARGGTEATKPEERTTNGAENQATGEMIMLAAVKYAFLKYKIGGNIVFDAKESVSTTGNSGVYLLYSAVRAKKILKNLEKKSANKTQKWLLNEFEKRITRKMLRYQQVLNEAIRELAPHVVANYLFELAQEFSRFYENCRVAGDDYEQERRAIVEVFSKIIEHGLGILGLSVPEEM